MRAMIGFIPVTSLLRKTGTSRFTPPIRVGVRVGVGVGVGVRVRRHLDRRLRRGKSPYELLCNHEPKR